MSVGDPAGVGPLVSVRAALECGASERFVLFGDADRLEAMLHREAAGRSVEVHRPGPEALCELPPGAIACVHTGPWDEAIVHRRAPSAEGGQAQIASLDAAVAAVRAGRARALVTGPTSKDAVHRAGIPFVGQTEHLASAAGLAADEVTMMFLGPRLRVALVSTHLAIRAVPDAIQADRVERAIVHLAEAVMRLRPPGGPVPRIAVTGLNPHAGERGLFGDEEGRAIVPGMELASARPPIGDGNVEIEGPFPAETAFREAAAGRWQGVVTMMHDQATIASKLLDWGRAVNVTWGLPFVRTSVDHGVAYDAAARGQAEHDGMRSAVEMAQRLTGSGGGAV
ncbi:MAG: PdxA family dehydrogenase [Myxococcota bacterium]